MMSMMGEQNNVFTGRDKNQKSNRTKNEHKQMQDVHYEYDYNIKTRESFTTLDKVINDIFIIKTL